MSVGAYRVNKMELGSETFNIYHDNEFYEWLNDVCDIQSSLNTDGVGLVEVGVQTLKDALEDKDLNLGPELRMSIENDIKWAEENNERFIKYYLF